MLANVCAQTNGNIEVSSWYDVTGLLMNMEIWISLKAKKDIKRPLKRDKWKLTKMRKGAF